GERRPSHSTAVPAGALVAAVAAKGEGRNMTSSTPNLEPKFTLVVLVLLAVLMVLIALITVLGNGLVILAFLVNKDLRHRSNYLFLNLAISDFLVGAFCIPLYIPYILTGKWMFGRLLCKLWLVVDYLMCTASAFSIVLISYDRFLSVTKAVTYRNQQGMMSTTVVKMVAVWVFAFLIYGPAILIWDFVAGYSIILDGECNAEFYYNWYFLLCASTFEFFTPCISVAYFNMHIYRDIQKRKRNRLQSTVNVSKQVSVPPTGKNHVGWTHQLGIKKEDSFSHFRALVNPIRCASSSCRQSLKLQRKVNPYPKTHLVNCHYLNSEQQVS
uniref:G-protein coupled receptors family 1 profile domain-containing protein n=1 Tax=Chelonoidis abingdonii TaxID=106734 RepID=A0A8C0G8V6_CHEAB